LTRWPRSQLVVTLISFVRFNSYFRFFASPENQSLVQAPGPLHPSHITTQKAPFLFTMANFSKPAGMMSMLFAFLSVLQFAAAFQHGANHAHSDVLIKRHLQEMEGELQKRQSGGPIPIKGVCSNGYASNGDCNGGSSAAPRLEIRDLAANSDAWNLYLLGMERFMSKDKREVMSFYQVSGVHGRPFVSWNNFPSPLVNQAGFCPHGMTLFGSWHRPYLAAYEQAWYKCVLEVIQEFPSNQQARLRSVASTLRMPFWDYARDPGSGPAVPTQIRDKQVTVTKPQGRVTIHNPLYSYSWGSSLPAEMGGGPWNNFPETLRRPVSNPTRSNNNEMNARFASIRISVRDRLFALFSSKPNWGAASTAAIGVRTDLSGSGVDSIESVHDLIHVTAGGESGGHMTYLDVAAFDPIFWLHHFNIDRLLAMLQLITPNTYVANGNVMRPMAQWNQGEPKNRYTPLKPFTKDAAGNYYTSQDVYETRTLGYYYPETSSNTYDQVVRSINSLYGAGVRSMSKRDNDVSETGQYLGRPLKEGEYHTVLSVTADKYALAGSYTVHCFVGKPDNSTTSNSTAPYPIKANLTLSANLPLGTAVAGDDGEAPYDPSTDYTQAPNYVGSYGILGGMMAGGSNSSQPLMTEGSMTLTSCLQGKLATGELKSLTPEHIESYLKENLYYKVVGVNGEINPDDLPNFHISVKCNKAKPAASENELPDLSAPYTVLPKATEHLPAGKPFTYVPSPLDIPVISEPGYSQPSAPGSYGSDGPGYTPSGNTGSNHPVLPWQEEGYCYSKQIIEYVDESGNFLYSQMVN
jgi:tyrosinase